MALIVMPVTTFLPKPARQRVEVRLTGTSTPALLTQIQVVVDPTNTSTKGSITGTKARVATLFAKHDKLVASLNGINTVVVTLTTSGSDPTKIVDFDSKEVASTGVSGSSSAPAEVSSADRGDGSISDSMIPL